MTIKIELTDQEANALRAIMDLGVKSGGINVAEAAAVLDRKLRAAVEDSKKEAEPSKE